MKYEILNNIILPEAYKPKPPIRKSKYNEQERSDRKKIAAKKWAEKNRTPEFNKKHNDRQRALNSESFQKSVLKARRKTIEKYNAKLEELAGRPKPLNCEICNDDGKICFDHCHTNHHFRGWICDRCNKVLGLVKDNSEVLEKLKIYIKTDIENAT